MIRRLFKELEILLIINNNNHCLIHAVRDREVHIHFLLVYTAQIMQTSD